MSRHATRPQRALLSGKAVTRRAAQIAKVLLLALLPIAISAWGIRWGLPSAERRDLYLSGPDRYPDVSEAEVRQSAKLYREFSDDAPRPRSTFNALRSCHPDEHYVLKGLANMDPAKGDFSTGLYGWPSLIFLIEGAGLALASAAGYVTLTHDLSVYFNDPSQIARMYLVGRWMVTILGGAAVVVLYFLGRDCYDSKTGLLAALIAGVVPLTTVHMRYMTGDVPMLFFVSVFLYLCSRIHTSSRVRWPLLAGAALGLAMSAKYKAVILLPLIPIAVYLRNRSRDRSAGKSIVRCFHWSVVAGVSLSVLMFAGLNWQVVTHMHEFWRVFSGEIGSVAMNAGAGGGISSVLRFFQVGSEAAVAPTRVLTFCVGPVVLILAIACCVKTVVRWSRHDFLFSIGFGLVYLTMGAIGTIYSRHMMLLLPFLVLLAARYILRAFEQLPRGSLRTNLTGMLVVLAIGPGLWRSIGYARLFAERDVRLDVARWITRTVPEGSSIGMPEVPWQYDTPPINEDRYDIVVTGYNAAALRSARPEFYLVSSRHRDPLLRKRTFERVCFWDALRSAEEYFAVRHFRRLPHVYRNADAAPPDLGFWLNAIGLSLDNSEAPEDMRYGNPEFTFFRRADVSMR